MNKLLTDEEYNKELDDFKDRYYLLNNYVMTHTDLKCQNDEYLKNAIEETKAKQYIVFHEDKLNIAKDGPTTNIIVSKKRSFEAAKAYKGKKVAVLNFANNHRIGGRPFGSAGAQEESLCRTSTLFRCLLKEEKTFYEYHQRLFIEGILNTMGNDDLIYSPNIVVFKTDESAPKMMEQKDWYKVDIITSAAPELKWQINDLEYQNIISNRLRKVFEVAKKEKVEVLILGAWGCGAFGNPPKEVARVFKMLCGEYRFDVVEFAVDDSRGSKENYISFANAFSL